MATVSGAPAIVHASKLATLNLGNITSVDVDCYRIPLETPLVDAAHGEHHFFELITCRVATSNGHQGQGYTYTGGSGGRAIAELIRSDLAPVVVGRDAADISGAWSEMQNRLHYVGRGGLLSFAISAIDIALWDVMCRAADLPLAEFISKNGPADSVDTYSGFIDLHKDGDDLALMAENAMAKGFVAIKTKVGREVMAEDVARVALLRSVIGGDKRLMIDANFSMSVESAIAFSKAVERYDIGWFEEPISPDNFEGYAAIADATNIPLAMGENLHIIEEFERAVRYSKLDILQPDASNIGGITGWLKVAEMARDAGLRVCSHGMHELHVSLLAAQADQGCLEFHSFPIDQYTHHPLALKDGRAVVPDRPGTGVEFNTEMLSPFRDS